MMFYPNTKNFFDEFDSLFDSPFFNNQNGTMKTDISEKDGNYLLDIELPGFVKEDINIDLHEGYLTISAKHTSANEETDEKGNIIRKERYSGAYSRSFYVGKNIDENDIKANYLNGELKITFPKENIKLPEKKKIMIE